MRVRALLLFAALVTFGGLAPGARAVEYEVVLLAGQSNMDGRANSSALPAGLQAAQTNVRFYNGNAGGTGFTPASTLTDLKPGASSFGPEITFGQSIAAANPSDQYALLKYAVGGTSLSADWKAPTAASPTTGGQYAAFKTTVSNGLSGITAGGNTYRVVGMLWLQGESDSTTAQAAAYEQNLKNLIADVRATHGANLPFVIGGVGYQNSVTESVSDAQRAVAASDPNVRYFSNDDLRPGGTGLHFDAAGMQLIGQRYSAALQSIPEPASVGAVACAAAVLTRRRSSRRRRHA